MSTRVYIETMGCQMNVSDTERAISQLTAAGFAVTGSSTEADVVLLNSCSVRERAEQKVFNRIGEIKKRRRGNQPLFGVMGCVAQLEGETLFDRQSPIKLVAGTGAIDRIPFLLDQLLTSDLNVIDVGERMWGADLAVPSAERLSPYVAFVPIIYGCNKFCTYCIVPFSRGREKSRTATDILDEIESLKAAGYREIHLIGQNVNSYRPQTDAGLKGVTGATPFSRLLRAVARTGVERIKFTTSFPRDFHVDIIQAMEENENLCKWVHLPVQSGNNRVLKAMRRGYSIENYLERVEKLRMAKSRVALTTDIIVGFPGETELEFNDTVHLLDVCQYDSIYAFRYSARSGTPAATLADDISESEKTDRLMRLIEVQKDVQKPIYQSFIGLTVKVLVEGVSAKSLLDMTGHTECNKVVNFPGGETLLGNVVDVRITEAKENSLYGELFSETRI